MSTKRFFFFAKRKQKISVASPVSQLKATPPALIQKYEMGTGKNKINVRIFMEPPVEPTITGR
jgi:hypothetical protein